MVKAQADQDERAADADRPPVDQPTHPQEDQLTQGDRYACEPDNAPLLAVKAERSLLHARAHNGASKLRAGAPVRTRAGNYHFCGGSSLGTTRGRGEAGCLRRSRTIAFPAL